MLDSEDFCRTKLWRFPTSWNHWKAQHFCAECHFSAVLWNSALSINRKGLFLKRWKFYSQGEMELYPGTFSRKKPQETGFAPLSMAHIHTLARFSIVHMFLAWSSHYVAFQTFLFVLRPSSPSSVQFHDSKVCFCTLFSSRWSNIVLDDFPLRVQLPASQGPMAKWIHVYGVQRRSSTTEKWQFHSCICSILFFSLHCLCCF